MIDPQRVHLRFLLIAIAILCAGDSRRGPASTEPGLAAGNAGQGAEAEVDQPASARLEMSAFSDLRFAEPWSGDLDGMADRRVVRALVTFSKTHYFFDGAERRGLGYDAVKTFETFLNKRLATGHLKIHMVFVPVPRDDLLPALVGGLGDLAVANLTITPERRERVDFSRPTTTDVDEIVVTGPAAPWSLDSLDDLAGREVWVRRSSSAFASLVALDARLRRAGKTGLVIREADPFLETEDLLEMVAAGLVPCTVVDSHLANFWSQVFDTLVLHPDLALRRGASIGWALRKGSPQLQAMVDDFIAEHRQGTLYGNLLIRRYLRSTRWAINSMGDVERRRFDDSREIFERYAAAYGFDWRMVIAQGFQESRLDQSVRSTAGAIGVMQLLPTTAADPAVAIADIEQLEQNVHAGIKYLRHVYDTYLDDDELDQLNRHLFAFAAYNAGPSRLRRLRAQAAEAELDPNVWFNHVERIAAREIGRETVQYVSNIAKYYIAFRAWTERTAETNHSPK